MEFFVFPEQNSESDPSWGEGLTDVHRHLPLDYGYVYRDSDLLTSAHETTHGINSHVRNNFNDTGQQANGFYVMEDRALILVEPAIRKSDINAYVPESLRGSRYDLYLGGMWDWDDMPTYIWDEWVAYTNGGAVGVDLVRSGLWRYDWRDGVMGSLEFTVYGLALGMAVEALDPDYFAEEEQFREFMAFQTERAMGVFFAGREMEPFAWDRQDALYRELCEGAGAEELRRFVRRTYGADWTMEVLGF